MISLLLVGLMVGVRLLLLARHTRALPELTLGLGFTLILAVGMPLSAAGRLPANVGTELGFVLFALGIAVVGCGVECFFLFTWRTFRPHAVWARVVTGLVTIAIVVLCIGFVVASSQGTTLAEILPRTRPWAMALVALLNAAFVWTGVESLGWYAKLRRRQALGLGDPVLANRFQLWGVAALTLVLLTGAILGFQALGMSILHEPVPMATTAALGIPASAAFYLTFLPPESYLRRLRHTSSA